MRKFLDAVSRRLLPSMSLRPFTTLRLQWGLGRSSHLVTVTCEGWWGRRKRGPGPSASLTAPLAFVAVQSLSHVWLFVTPWTAARQASLSFTVSRSLLKLASIESVMPSNHLILRRPFSSCPQSFPGSGSFPVSAFHIRWPKYRSFSISPSDEYSGLTSFRMGWFDFLTVQGTLKSLL